MYNNIQSSLHFNKPKAWTLMIFQQTGSCVLIKLSTEFFSTSLRQYGMHTALNVRTISYEKFRSIHYSLSHLQQIKKKYQEMLSWFQRDYARSGRLVKSSEWRWPDCMNIKREETTARLCQIRHASQTGCLVITTSDSYDSAVVHFTFWKFINIASSSNLILCNYLHELICISGESNNNRSNIILNDRNKVS